MSDAQSPYPIDDIVSTWCFKLSELGSEIRRVFLLGQHLKQTRPELDIIDLSLGNPDLEPPIEVKKALLHLIEKGEPGAHRYMDNAGLLSTREFLSRELSKSEGVDVQRDSVFMTCGAAGALQIVLRTVLSPGDEVVFFAPYFVEYLPYVVDMGNVPVIVECDEDHVPLLEQFEKSLTSKTRAVIINSPNNPTGVVYSEKVLSQIAGVLKRHHQKTGKLVHLISDEPYARLVFSNVTLPSMLKLYDATWLVRSHSKDLGLAGERIGYVAWGPRLAHPQTLAMLRNSARAIGFPNAPALMQRLLPHVYHSSVDIGEYEKRVRLFVDTLETYGVHTVRPGGSFFVFPKSPIPDDKKFCEIVAAQGVLVVPGSGFGKAGYFRASLTQSIDRLVSAAHIIGKAARNCNT